MTEREDDGTEIRDERSEEHVTRDEELGRLLRLWRTPAVSDALDERILGEFRRATGRQPWWRRWLSVSIPVPLPVAVAALLLLLASAALILRRPASQVPHEPQLAAVTRTADRQESSGVRQTSLAGFRPVEDMNVTVVTGGGVP
jgi:hypothetical protein